MVARQFRVLEAWSSNLHTSTKTILSYSSGFLLMIERGFTARLFWARSPTAAGGGSREGDLGAAVEEFKHLPDAQNDSGTASWRRSRGGLEFDK